MHAVATAPHLSIPTEEPRDHSAQSSLVQRLYLHTYQKPLFVFGEDYGLGGPLGIDHCLAMHFYMRERGGGIPIRWMTAFVLKRWSRLSPDMPSQR